MELSVVVPTYRASAHLTELVDRLTTALGHAGVEFEIILVDDGSEDETWPTLVRLQRLHSNQLTVIRLAKRSGQQWATICGLDHAQGSVIATLDDDLQHPPDELVRLYRYACQSEIDLVYGLYIPNQPDIRRLMGMVVRAILCDRCELPLNPTAFRIIQRSLLLRVLGMAMPPSPVLDLLLSRQSRHFGGLVVRHDVRRNGRSTYTLGSLIRLTMSAVRMRSRRQKKLTALPLGERGYQVAEIAPADGADDSSDEHIDSDAVPHAVVDQNV